VTPDSFADDPLRVVRAAQFAARFGFYIESGTMEMANNADIESMANERTTEELLKVFRTAGCPSYFFECLNKMGKLQKLFPEIYILREIPQDPVHHPEGNVYIHTMDVLDRSSGMDVVMMLTALLHDTGKADTTVLDPEKQRLQSLDHEDSSAKITTDFFRRYRVPEKISTEVIITVRNHMKPHNLVKAGAYKLKHKHRLMASVTGGYLRIMKDPKKAIERYNRVIDFAILDSNGKIHREKYERLKVIPPLEHYYPKIFGRDLLEEGLKGRDIGARLEERYINQINNMQENMYEY
jgi:tRNA nucleotidyltransferase (CCA-adding enzyme)